MKSMKLIGSFLAAMLTAVTVMPAMHTSAAIPCQELPVIEADPMMPVPMIFIELPVTLEAALSRGGEADRTNASEISEDDAAGITLAAKNQFRCLDYGMDTAFVGNSTPQQRVLMFARPDIEAEIEQYIAVDSLYLVQLDEPIGLEDGRFLIDFGVIVDGNTFLTGELVFTSEDDGYYLDGAAVAEPVELNDEPVTVELSTRFTREVKVINATNGDTVVFDNTEEENSANIVITDGDGATIFEGFAGGTHLVGGENSNIFVVHNIEPGEYQVTVTFSPDDVTYGATLVIQDSDSATPEASPES